MIANPTRAREIFVAAVKLSPEQWDAFLTEACGGDEALRDRVRSLLIAHRDAGSFLDPAVAALPVTTDEPVAERLGTLIGPYKLLQQIGEGGMGAVYMAEQTEPVKRKVALKVIKPGMDSRQVVARFEAERQALAMMDHVNIARVFDGGSTENGRPYFVMELVHGIPITKYCDDNHLTPRQRLELFVPVCQAIQHAHQKGIIHRDIKPSNVMVTLYDGKPVPKVIDFGVAKATEQKLTERTLFTQYGTMIGTLEYMSPEQAEMSALGVDTRSDIYSLGVLLYELLTGSTPLTHKRMKEGAYAEILRMIKEEEPPRPSTRLSDSGEALASISAQRKTEPAKLTKLVRGELDWIVMKTLEKDRNRRYETANGLAADVQRYLADEQVLACPPSTGYRLRKFVRKNRGPVIAAALVLLSVVGGAIGALYGVIESGRQRTAALQRQIDDEQRAAAERDRVGRNAEAVSALLDQTEQGLRANDTGRAALAMAAAEKRAADGGAESHGARLERLRNDLDLLRALDEIDQFRWALAEEGWRPQASAVAARLREMLGRFGLGPGTAAPEELARRIGGSTVRDRLVSALDRLLVAERPVAVRAVLRAADSDGFRDRVRDAILAGDGLALTDLAGRPEAAGQPPGFLAVLGADDAIPGETRQRFLTAAVQRRPADFDLLMALGGLFVSHQAPPGLKGRKELDRWSRDARAADARERLRWAQAAVAAAPANPVAHHYLGNVLHDTGDLNEAIAELREAIRLDPKYPGALFVLANVLNEKGDLDGAIAALTEAVRVSPDGSGVAQYNLRGFMEVKGNPDGEIAVYRELSRQNPKNGSYRIIAGLALWEKGDFDGAIAEFREATRIDPNHARAHWNLGNALRRKGDLDGAIAGFREAIRLGLTLGEVHMRLGNALLEKGDLDAAIAVFLENIRVNPTNDGAHNGLGRALGRRGDAAGAVAEYTEALRLSPKHVDAHNNLAAMLASGPDGVRDGRRAVEHATKACELSGWEEPRYIGILAAAHAEAGKFDKAVEYQQKALTFAAYEKVYGAQMRQRLDLYAHKKPYRDPVLAPRGVAAPNGAVGGEPDSPAGYVQRGNALFDTKDPHGAGAAFRAAIRLDPTYAPAHYNLGRVLHVLGNPDGAEAAYRQTVRLDGNRRGAAIDALAELLLSRGKLKEAVATCRTIVALDPEDAGAHYRLGNALKTGADPDGASAAYRKAVELLAKADRPADNLSADSITIATCIQHFRRMGDLASCRNAAAALEKKNPADAATLYNAARCRALTADAQAQAKVPDAATLAKEEADRAMAWLTKAVAAGFADAAGLGDDADLDPLRDREDFRKLLADVMAKATPAVRARYYIRLSRWDEAAAEYAKADLLAQRLSDDAFAYACLFLIRGDGEGYDRFCQSIMRRAGPGEMDPFEAYVLARSCAMARKSPVDPTRAVEWANQAVARAQPAWYFHALALAQHRAGQFDNALKSFAKSNAGWAYRDLNCFGLALAHLSKGHPDEARRWLDRGVAWLEREGVSRPGRPTKLQPQDWLEAQLLRREAEGRLAAEGDALRRRQLADAREAVALKPNDHLARTELGKVLAAQGMLDEAIEELRAALRLKADAIPSRDRLASALNERAWALVTAPEAAPRDPRRAVGLATEATDLAPKDADFWNTLGAARYRAGDWRGAVAALQKYRELRANDAEWSNPFFLAMAHWRMGNMDEAGRWYDMGTEWMAKRAPKSESLRHVRDEAARLLGLPEKKD